MKKILLYPLLILSLLCTLGAYNAPTLDSADLAAGYSFSLNGKPLSFDAQPQLLNGTMMVPLRAIAEAMGAEISWNADKQIITAVKDEMTVHLAIDSTTAQRNQDIFHLNSAPILAKGTTFVPIRFFSEAFGSIVKWDGIQKRIAIENDGVSLPLLGSYQNLQALLAQYSPQYSSDIKEKAAIPNPVPAAEAKTSASPAVASNDHSTTNVQVLGVDEADIVKTDGQYIYQVNKQRIIVAKVLPADQMQIVATIPFEEQQFKPTEIYLDDTHLIVIGSTNNNYNYSPEMKLKSSKMVMPVRANGTVKALIYDIRTKSSIKKIREIELEGSYISSRKIGSNLYLLANQFVNTYSILNEKTEVPAPAYRDSLVSDTLTPINYDHIRYFPHSIQPSYLLVAGVNLDQPDKKANVEAYLGAGQSVFASEKNLYVTLTQSKTVPAAGGEQVKPTDPNSVVYKFMLDQDKVRFVGSGEVPGTVLNQYAMDEQGGYFRIATTKGQIWRNDETTSKNNVYIMNEAMAITGKIEDIAPGEKIYSTRFMGNRLYMVTFKQVDPLFVIDLSNPQAPKILGSLKIPGYSAYLHPYDETHIIGFGKDAVEVSNGNGGIVGGGGTTAFYQGLKIALFDVSDVNHPTEMFKESIGDRGTDSELLRNPKALLFNKDKGLLAFPVTLMKINSADGAAENKLNTIPAYGQFAYQGAYIYNLDLVHGFSLKGTLTHLTQEQQRNAGGNWYNSDSNISRILYIGSTLYTLSNSEIKANDLNTLQPISSLKIPK